MSQLKNISGAKLTYLAATAAIAISNEFDNEDINILSSLISAIGDNLGIIAAQQEALSNSKSNPEGNSKSNPEGNSKSNPESNSKSSSKSNSESNPESNSKSDTKSDTKSNSENNSKGER
jgi:cytoskeletal protein RodZ